MTIGINKIACESCHEAIVGKGVTCGYGQPGTTPPSYYVHRDDDDADTIATFHTGETELRQKLADEVSNPVMPTIDVDDGLAIIPARPTIPDEAISPAGPTVETDVISPARSTVDAEVISPARPTVETDVISPARSTVDAEVINPARPTVDENNNLARPTIDEEISHQARPSADDMPSMKNGIKSALLARLKPSIGIDAGSVLDFVENVDKGSSTKNACLVN